MGALILWMCWPFVVLALCSEVALSVRRGRRQREAAIQARIDRAKVTPRGQWR